MPASWSDDFSHDYFADGTYTGMIFDPVSGGQCVVPDGFTAEWLDPRSVATVPFTWSMDITDAGHLGFLQGGVQTGFWTNLIGFAIYDSELAWPFPSTVSIIANDLSNQTSYVLPSSGPITVEFDVTSSTATLKVNGTVVATLGLTGMTPLPGATPGAQMSPRFGDDVVATVWSYDIASPPPPPPAVGAITAGDHSTGFARA